MKILIYSHPPTAMTGFGRVIHYLSDHLSKKHDVYILPVTGYCGKPFQHERCVILPGIGSVAGSAKWCTYWAQHLKVDVVIQHFDVWMLPEGWIEEVPCPVITYAPVDSANLPRNFVEASGGAAMNVAMSLHAARLFEENNMQSAYIPHGVDTKTFTQLSQNMCRSQLGLPLDKFIVGIVATNGSIRKNIGGQVEAYKLFADENTLLYLHTLALQAHPESFDLQHLATGRNDIVWTDPDIYTIGVEDSALNVMYNSFNVLLQCSLGEGFGLPILEAQACRVPVVVNSGTGHEELATQGGLVARNSVPLVLPHSTTTMFVPDPTEVAQLLKQLLDPVTYESKCQEALQQAKHFDWEVVLPMWDNLLREF
jgi:glycosyltransferase involved in cell wall biosynthesis